MYVLPARSFPFDQDAYKRRHLLKVVRPSHVNFNRLKQIISSKLLKLQNGIDSACTYAKADRSATASCRDFRGERPPLRRREHQHRAQHNTYDVPQYLPLLRFDLPAENSPHGQPTVPLHNNTSGNISPHQWSPHGFPDRNHVVDDHQSPGNVYPQDRLHALSRQLQDIQARRDFRPDNPRQQFYHT